MSRRQNALCLIMLTAWVLAACQTTSRLAPQQASLTTPNAGALLDHPSATTRPA